MEDARQSLANTLRGAINAGKVLSFSSTGELKEVTVAKKINPQKKCPPVHTNSFSLC